MEFPTDLLHKRNFQPTQYPFHTLHNNYRNPITSIDTLSFSQPWDGGGPDFQTAIQRKVKAKLKSAATAAVAAARAQQREMTGGGGLDAAGGGAGGVGNPGGDPGGGGGGGGHQYQPRFGNKNVFLKSLEE